VTLALKRILPNDYDVIHEGEMGPWLTRGRRLDPLACTECQMSICLRRRDFITLLGGAATWPLAARAQQRRIGILLGAAQSDRDEQASLDALREELAKLGWSEGRNLRIDLRFGVGDPDRIGAYAAELVGLAPDVILAIGGAATRALQQRTQTIPIVFTGPDPVGAGILRNIARPEGNITGFSVFEPSIVSKWLELLKEAAPRLARVAIIFNPELTLTASRYLSPIEVAASALGVLAVSTPVRNAVDIVHAIDAFAAEPNGGLLVLPPPPNTSVRNTILQLADHHKLPAIYPSQPDAAAGGLLAYATDVVDLHRRAASYIDRLLRGAKINELPVQFPTKFGLVINLKAAKAIDLNISPALLGRADEVIE
jgi:putative ABC transport system substrate-binding protein